MEESPGLLTDGLRNRIGRMPEPADRNACEEVEVLVALGIPQSAALPPHKGDGLAGVRVHHVLVGEGDDVVSGHTGPPEPRNGSTAKSLGSRRCAESGNDVPVTCPL
jgi:hypothetical protein